jgi:transcriptional regulator with PAS, ATPase and Fis domain
MEHTVSKFASCRLIGKSENIRKVKEMIKHVAPTDARVLITGETGTGKTLIASIIHNLHPKRKNYNFCSTNIGALVPTLAQSQLYGHVANAFTGAVKKADGIVFESHNGTLFLDEIATAHPEVQIMLLSLLEIPVVNPVGGSLKDQKQVNTRLITATTYSPHELLNLESFRNDLFFRISEYIIELKALRERIDDIRLLSNHFLDTNNSKVRCPGKVLDDGGTSDPLPELKNIEPDALQLLEDYNWPGNVRELEHVIRSAMVESRVDPSAKTLRKEWIKFPTYSAQKRKNSIANIQEKDLLFSWDIARENHANGCKRIELKEHVDRFRSVICSQLLDRNHNNQTLTAKMLGIDVGSLVKYKNHNINYDEKISTGDNTFCRVLIVKI